MKTTNFWSDGLGRGAVQYDEPVPARVDVAVVGGGYTGLAAARQLALDGARVAVLERETMGWGASSRNGGMLSPGLKAPTRKVFDRYGSDLGRQLWQASLDAMALVEELITAEGIECGYQRRGYMALAYRPAHFTTMLDSAEWHERELGYRQHPVPREEISLEIGSTAYFGGLVSSAGAGLDPARYVVGLAAAAARAGATLCEQAGVREVERIATGFSVQTGRGHLVTDAVLMATNGYTDRLVGRLAPRVFPVGSYIIVTAPLDKALQEELSPNGRTFYDSKNFLNYFRLTPDGRMLFGGRNDLSTNLDLHESAARLRQRMVTVFPQLRESTITHTWTGRLGLTFDLVPHIGQVEGIHYALGYGGHGVALATYVGTEAGLLLSGQKLGSPFQEIPHPTRFFYRGRPWFVPAAAAYFRLLDRIS
jgi:glycine/D-amino acid oxidase-like deaminating enzyme